MNMCTYVLHVQLCSHSPILTTLDALPQGPTTNGLTYRLVWAKALSLYGPMQALWQNAMVGIALGVCDVSLLCECWIQCALKATLAI